MEVKIDPQVTNLYPFFTLDKAIFNHIVHETSGYKDVLSDTSLDLLLGGAERYKEVPSSEEVGQNTLSYDPLDRKNTIPNFPKMHLKAFVPIASEVPEQFITAKYSNEQTNRMRTAETLAQYAVVSAATILGAFDREVRQNWTTASKAHNRKLLTLAVVGAPAITIEASLIPDSLGLIKGLILAPTYVAAGFVVLNSIRRTHNEGTLSSLDEMLLNPLISENVNLYGSAVVTLGL